MNGPVLLISINECATPYPVFPLGMAHLCAALRTAGHTVIQTDLMLDSAGLEETIRATAPAAIGISLRNIDDIRIDDTVFFAPHLKRTVARVRAVSSAPVIVGGSGYALFPRELLEESGADYGIVGEGEASLVALLQALEQHSDLSAIAGLVSRTPDGAVRINPRAPLDSAAITPPHREVRLSQFYDQHSSMLNVQTQRGCAFECCYCTYPLIEGSRFRCRPAGEVADDIQSAIAAGARYLFFVDSVFNTSPAHVSAVCDELIRRSITIPWGCFLRPQGLTRELMELMKRAGLSHIEFGSDALCDSVLQAYGKNFTFDDVLHASECARLAGVHYAHFLIIGGPGETEQTINESFANSRRIRRSVFFPFVGMRIYPQTPLWRTAVEQGLVAPDDPLLTPRFYCAPGLDHGVVRSTLENFHREDPRWIIDDMPPEHLQIMAGLRRRGVVGPLWEFLIR